MQSYSRFYQWIAAVETPEMSKLQRRLNGNERRKTKYHIEARSSDHKDGTAALRERRFLDNERRRMKYNDCDKGGRTEKRKNAKNQNDGSPRMEKQKQEDNDRKREGKKIKQRCNIDRDTIGYRLTKQLRGSSL